MRLPLQIATVGLSTFSITRLNGSVSPVESSASRCCDQRRRTWRRGRSTLALELADGVDQLADRFDLGRRFMLMRMSNSSSTVATKSITVRLSHSRSWAKRVASVDLDALLVERLDQARGSWLRSRRGRSCMAPYAEARRFRNAMGRDCGGGGLEAARMFPMFALTRVSPSSLLKPGSGACRCASTVDRAVARRQEDSIVAAKQTQSYFASSNVREGSKADIVAA